MSLVWVIIVLIALPILTTLIDWVLKAGFLPEHPTRRHIIAAVIAIVAMAVLVGIARSATDLIGSPDGSARLAILDVKEEARKPLFGEDFFDEDEILAVGKATQQNIDSLPAEEYSIVPFWKLPNHDYDTSWHASRSYNGDQWVLNTIGLDHVAGQRQWEFTVAGVECPVEYSGVVEVALVAMPNRMVRRNEQAWIDTDVFTEMESLPDGSDVVRSSTNTFNTKPIREGDSY
jgi:hypothetical protein